MISFKYNKNNSYIPIFLFLLAGILWRTSLYIVSLYVAIPLLILFCIIFYYKDFFNNKYSYLYLFVLFWIFLSSIVNPHDAALDEIIPIIASYLLSFSIYSIAYRNNKYNGIFLSYIALFAFLLYMNITSENFTSNFSYSNELERMNNNILNANEFAYYSLYAIMSIGILIHTVRYKIRPIYILAIYCVCGYISLYVALMTASRQVLALNIPMLILFSYIDFFKNGGNKRNIVILLGAMIIILLLPYMQNMFNDSYLATRSEVGFQDDVRNYILIEAIYQGFDNPMFGLGLGAKTFFSHCTYTHILSRCGFPAAIGFIILIIKCLWEQFKRYRITKKINFLLYFFCISIIFVGHFLYSYIDQPFLMPIMFAIIGISDREFKILKQSI